MITVLFSQDLLLESYATWSEKNDISQKYLRAVVLTDCAKEYTSLFGISAPSLEKSTRLLLAHIRGDFPTIGVSYIDAIFNLSDVGAQLRASRDIWKKFIASSEFNISFPGKSLAREGRAEIGSSRIAVAEKSVCEENL